MQPTDSISRNSFSVLDDRRIDLAPGLLQHFSSEDCRRCHTRKSGYFCNLASVTLTEKEAISTPHNLPDGGVLFTEGQSATSVSIICGGRLKLTRSSRNGKTLLVRIACAGEALGLSGAIANHPHEVTAQAIEAVQLRTIQRKEFLEFIRRNSEASLRAAETMSREYRGVMDDAYRLALSSSIAGRVAHLLLAFARENQTDEHAQPEIDMPLKHEELAFKLGSTRESVTRVLNDLKRAGVLSIKGTRMVLLNKGALRQLL